MNGYRIGQITEMLGLSPDTLRYYEKLGLLTGVARSSSGLRIYSDRDVSRLRFIKRTQKMNFSLAEIGILLKMRENPQRARNNVRLLTARKLTEVENRLKDLETLRKELQLLLNLCQASDDGCPIIEGLNEKT